MFDSPRLPGKPNQGNANGTGRGNGPQLFNQTNRDPLMKFRLLLLACLAALLISPAMTDPPSPPTRTYSNVLTPIKNPRPILADHPEFFAPIIEQAHFEAAPLVVGDVVYVGSTDGFLYALKAKTGKVLWKYETDAEIIGAANRAVRPKAKDEVIIVGSYDNFVHCVDAKKGKGLWKFETNNYINGVPTILDGDKVVFGGATQFFT